MRSSVDGGQWLGAGFGIAFLIAGVVGIAESWTTPGWIVLLGLSVVCVLFAVASPRMSRTTVKISLEGITVTTELDPQLKEQIKSTGFDGAVAAYTFIHAQLANDAETQAVKVRLQDELVAVAADLAAKGDIKREDVANTIRDGVPAARPLAFGVLAAQPQWATADLLVQGIADSLSANEQYHALLAAEAAWPKLEPDERQRVQEAVRWAKWISQDTDRADVAARIRTLPIA
jgi:hypothetical protein